MIKSIIKHLKSHNFNAWICGGTARDLKLNRTIINYDVAIAATMQELQQAFKSRIKSVDSYSTSITITYKDTDVILYPLKKVYLENTYYKFEYSNHLEDDAASRDFTINELKINGWEILPSLANFIFIRKNNVSGREIYEKLKNEGLLVRYFGHQGIENFVRVTIGKKEDMLILIQLLKKLWSK